MNNQPFNLNQMPTGNLSVGSATPNTLSVSGGSSALGTLPVTGAPAYSSPSADSQPQQKGNWFTHLIPTALGTLGTIGGAFIPGLGETGVGEIAGGTAGQTAGQAIENWLEGNKIDKNLAGAALTGGVSAGVGKVVGLGTKAALGGLSKGAGTLSSKLLAGQAPEGALSRTTADFLNKIHGVTNLSNGAELAAKYTGSSENPEGQAIITKSVENGLLKYGPKNVNIDDVMPPRIGGKLSTASKIEDQVNQKTFNQMTDKLLLSDQSQKTLSKELLSMKDNIQVTNASGDISSYDALQLQRAVAKNADYYDNLAKGFNPDPEYSKLANAYKGLSQELKDRIFSDPKTNNSLKIPDAEKQLLFNQIDTHVTPFNAQSAGGMKAAVANAQTYSELRSLESPFVQLSDASEQATKLGEKTFGTTVGKALAFGGPGFALGGPVGGAIGLGLSTLPTSTLESAGSKLFSKTASSLAPSVKTASGEILKGGAVGRVLPTLTRMGSAGVAQVPMFAANLQGGQDMQNNIPLGDGATSSSGMPSGANGASIMDSIPLGGGSFDQTSQSMNAGAGGQAGTPGQLSLRQLAVLNMISPGLASALTLSQGQRDKLGQVNQANAALTNLTDTFNKAGGGRGGLFGTIETLGSKLSKNDVAAFNDQKTSVANQIANATGLDAKAVLQQLPSVTDTGKAAQEKIQALKDQITSSAQAAQVTGVGGSNLGSLLGGLGNMNSGGGFNYASATPTSSIPGLNI
jgi:hypothetical protein